MCEDSIVLPSGIICIISFGIITGSIVVTACFDRYIFAPESEISIMLLPGELGGVPIQLIKIILGLLISILFIINLNPHLPPFLLLPSLLL